MRTFPSDGQGCVGPIKRSKSLTPSKTQPPLPPFPLLSQPPRDLDMEAAAAAVSLPQPHVPLQLSSRASSTLPFPRREQLSSQSKRRSSFFISSTLAKGAPDLSQKPSSSASPTQRPPEAPLKRVHPDSLQYESGFLGGVSEKTRPAEEADGAPTAMWYLTNILSSKVYDVAIESPLQLAPKLSQRIGVDVWLKREDLQPV